MLFLIRVKYTFFYASPQSKPTYHRLTFGVTKGKKNKLFLGPLKYLNKH